ncbi:hypothetical protein LJC42_06650 [Eubacteriales bacterium OttesenSCG-928-K08]|nr:hypothetical protein [Eubacteriales bacterium OttesenSCG-928-K08]
MPDGTQICIVCGTLAEPDPEQSSVAAPSTTPPAPPASSARSFRISQRPDYVRYMQSKGLETSYQEKQPLPAPSDFLGKDFGIENEVENSPFQPEPQQDQAEPAANQTRFGYTPLPDAPAKPEPTKPAAVKQAPSIKMQAEEQVDDSELPLLLLEDEDIQTAKKEFNPQISSFGYFGIFLLLSVPGLNLLLLLIWALGGCKKPSKRFLARGMLLYIAVLLILLFAGIIWFTQSPFYAQFMAMLDMFTSTIG